MNRVIKKKDVVINNTFVQMMEALGYDIEIKYVKRKSDGEWYRNIEKRYAEADNYGHCNDYRVN